MKFKVTPELTVTIKTMRNQKNISVKDLASHINKSNSYISKLESGDVKNIEESDLTKILMYINGGGDMYEDVLPQVVRTLNSFIDPKNITDQLWLFYYDVTIRPVTVPPEMAADMREKLGKTSMSYERFTEIINKNMDSELDSGFPANEILSFDHYGKTRLLIRLQMSEEQVRGIMEDENASTTYMFLQAIVFRLMRHLYFPDKSGKLPAENAEVVLKETAEYMDRFNMSTLTGYTHLMASDEYTKGLSSSGNVVSSLNKTDDFTLNSIVDLLNEALQHRPIDTAKALRRLEKSLLWDTSFTLKLLSVPFYKTDNLSYTHKKEMLRKISDILAEYENMSDFERSFEDY